MPKVIFVIGVVATGKSCFAKQMLQREHMEYLDIYDYQQHACHEEEYGKFIPLVEPFCYLTRANALLIDDILENMEEVIVNLRHKLYSYDNDGNPAFTGLRKEERAAALIQAVEEQDSLGDEDYLNFPEKEKYLKNVLSKARNIMRKGTMVFLYEVSAEIPDSYLDDLLALRWRENLKLWAIQWEPGPEGRKGGTRPCQTEGNAKSAGTS